MLEKIYCHTKPEAWDISSTYCEVGKWYYYHSYRAATENAEPKDYSHFDIKESNDRTSRTRLCRHISDMHLFFYTEKEYRENVLSVILD